MYKTQLFMLNWTLCNINVYYAHLFFYKVKKKKAKETKSSYMRHGNKSDSKRKGEGYYLIWLLHNTWKIHFLMMKVRYVYKIQWEG